MGMASARAATPTADGLYAVFQIRRGAVAVGEFTCQLEFTKAPRTVANFVGLAEGTVPFLDAKLGHAVARPYYDGIVFHRVVPGFVIQGGSPNGQGNDGPGYSFRDEFDTTLRHDKAGILSMANSGLNSNGSQFFVTLAATAWLNDVHSVFGHVVDGLNVVTNVAQGDVIAKVSIIRNGAAAKQFTASSHGIPVVSDARPSLVAGGNGFLLNYAQPTNSEIFVYHSDDLARWTSVDGMEMHGTTSASVPRDVSAVTVGKSAKFFEVTRVQYPDALLTPASVAGKAVRLVDGGGFTVAFSLTNAVSGNYQFIQSSGALGPFPVGSYSWSQEAYRGRLVASMTGLSYGGDPIVQANVSLVFSSPTNGTYAGNLYTGGGQSVPMKGTVTVSGP